MSELRKKIKNQLTAPAKVFISHRISYETKVLLDEMLIAVGPKIGVAKLLEMIIQSASEDILKTKTKRSDQ